MCMKTKTVVVPVEGDLFGKEFVLKSLSFGDECDMADELEANAIGEEIDEKGNKTPKYPKGLSALLLLEKSIVSGPVKTKEEIHDMDPEVARFLLEECNDISRPLVKTKSKKSPKPSEQEVGVQKQ